MADLVYSVRLSADNSGYVGPVKAATQETNNLTQANINARAAQITATEAIVRQSLATDALGDSLRKTLDRYDPLGAKLRSLTADFDLLDRAMKAGVGSDANTAAVDLAYRKINTSIASTKALMAEAGVAGAAGFGAIEKGGLAAAFSTAQARRELIVLGHEALQGNFSRMPGSFMVLAERMGSSVSLFSALTLGVVAAGAAVIGMAVAFVKGQHEVESMNNALAVTNNYAGQTRTGMRELAASMTEAGTVTIGAAKEIVTELVSSGRIGAEAINSIASLAGPLAEALGADIGKIAAELIKIFDDPIKGAQELDKQMHFLTITDMEHIKVLVEMGDKQEAQIFLAGKLTDALPKQAENVGFLTSAWRTFKNALSETWDVMQSIGRTNTSGEALAAAKRQRDYLEVTNAPPEAIAAANAAVDAASLLARADESVARAKGEAAAAGEKQKTVWNSITKASKEYAIQAKETELAAAQAFSPENADQARIQADAVKNLTEQIAKMRAGPGPKVDDTAQFIERINQQAALEKEANSAALTDAKQLLDEQVAINKEMYDAKRVDEVTYLAAVQADNQAYAASATAIAQQQIYDANTRLGVLTEIQVSQSLTAKQEVELEKAVAAAYLETKTAADNLNKVRNAGSTQYIKDGGAIAAALAKEDQSVARVNADYLKYLDGLKKIDGERAFQLSLIGQSTEAILLLTATHKAELEVDSEIAKLQEQEAALDSVRDAAKIAALDLIIAKVRESRDARIEAAKSSAVAEQAAQDSFATGWQNALNAFNKGLTGAAIAQQAFNTLTTSMENLFVGMATHATNAFKTFKDALLQMIAQIAAKIAVSGILQLLGIGGGAFSFAGAAAGATGGAGTLGSFSNLLGAGSSLYKFFGGVGAAAGGPSAAVAATEFGGQFGAGGAATGLAGGGGAAAAGGFGGLSLGTLGIVGLVAMAAPYIIGAFKREGGAKAWEYATGLFGLGDFLGVGGKGPNMTRGYGTSGADISTFGDFSATHKLVGTDAVGSEALGSAARQAKADYLAAVKALGGTASDAQFAIYTSSDTKGTAPEQVDVRATVGGKAAYTANVEDQIKHGDTAGAAARAALETDRAIFAALQQSKLPQIVSNFLKQFDAATISSETIKSIESFAVAMRALELAANGSAEDIARAAERGRGATSLTVEAHDAYKLATESSTESLKRMGDNVIELARNSDGSTESIVNLANATAQYRQAAIQAIVAIKLMQQSLKDMFAGTREQVEFAGLTKQQRYDLDQQKGSAYLEQITTSNDPAFIERASQKINQYWLDAFNLLSPEEQLAHKSEFLAKLDEVDALVNQRLSTIADTIGTDTAGPFAAAQKALDDAATKFVAAAATQQKAADKMGAAADKINTAADTFSEGATVNVAVVPTPQFEPAVGGGG